ncbi:MAG: hypothetical protein WCE52_13515 [Candidatus Acidiferrum sp.]
MRFHAAGAAGFLRAKRRVEPDVAALDQVASDGDVVAFEEDQFATKFGASSKIDDCFDELLTVIIARMGFASVGRDDSENSGSAVRASRRYRAGWEWREFEEAT